MITKMSQERFVSLTRDALAARFPGLTAEVASARHIALYITGSPLRRRVCFITITPATSGFDVHLLLGDDVVLRQASPESVCDDLQKYVAKHFSPRVQSDLALLSAFGVNFSHLVKDVTPADNISSASKADEPT